MNGGRRGHYETRQRRAVLHELAQAPGFLSAQALHAHLRQAGETIALTTVYRALHVLADAGRLGSIYDAAGEQLFHLGLSPGRDHYLVWRACDASVSIDSETAEDWAATIASDHGFTDIHLIVELTGLCPACITSKP